MSDIIQATETYIERPVNGVPRKFRLLTGRDRGKLMQDYLLTLQAEWRERRQRLVENMDVSAITESSARFGELETFEERWPYPTTVTEQHWWRFINDVRNDVIIYRQSLMDCNGELDTVADAANLSINDRAKICDVQVVRKNDNETSDNPTDSPNVSAPTDLKPYGATSQTGQ